VIAPVVWFSVRRSTPGHHTLHRRGSFCISRERIFAEGVTAGDWQLLAARLKLCTRDGLSASTFDRWLPASLSTIITIIDAADIVGTSSEMLGEGLING
jgi:hypothetical protein